MVRVDEKNGKRSRTLFELLEKFNGWSLLKCQPLTGRTHQIRVHLRVAGVPVAGDTLYGGGPLLLWRREPNYRVKPNPTELRLPDCVSLTAAELGLPQSVTGT